MPNTFTVPSKALEQALNEQIANGYRLVNRGPDTLAMVKPKSFSFLAFLLLLLFGIVPGILYVGWYASKRDSTVFLAQNADGSLTYSFDRPIPSTGMAANTAPGAPVAARPANDTVPCRNCGTLIQRLSLQCFHCHTPTNESVEAAAAAALIPSERPCPFCETLISITAKKCRQCGEWVVPESERGVLG